MIPSWLLIAAGGAIGAIARHGVNAIIHQRMIMSRFPIGIFVINVAGSFAIGLLAGLFASERLSWGPGARTFAVVGVLGGFTTFSSFSFDTLTLVHDGLTGYAMVNAIGQVALSLIAVWAGFTLGRV